MAFNQGAQAFLFSRLVNRAPQSIDSSADMRDEARWGNFAIGRTAAALVCARVGRGKRATAMIICAPNGPEVNPRGQGPRGYGSAARRLPAFEARDAGGVTPRTLR